MAFHHIALATRDLPTTHRFYTEACGFELVRVEANATPDGQGWARHLFYDTGDGAMFAVWDLHTPAIPADHPTAISVDLGLPDWVNHVAFAASSLDDLRARRERWVDHGNDVVEIDHGWCTSIYAKDPNGVLVEFCVSTRAFTDDDKRAAHELLLAEVPEIDATPPDVQFFVAAPAN